MAQLAELYDADKRTRDPRIRELAAKYTIPHPLNNVQYADGISWCRHAKKAPAIPALPPGDPHRSSGLPCQLPLWRA